MVAEFLTRARNGWLMLIVQFLATGACIYGLVQAILAVAHPGASSLQQFGPAAPITVMRLVTLAVLVCWFGFFTLQPNEAAVLLLFGAYKGTVRQPGFGWASPFIIKKKLSQRVRTLN